jgi:hypothetical protein
MKAPPLLISAALLFWGWQTGLLPLAICFAAAIELQRFLKTQREISRTEWNHLADICTIILLGILIVGFSHDKARLIYDTGKLLPIIFFPLLIAQTYSVAGKVELAALSLLTRKQKKSSHRLPPADIQYPYFFVCLLAAGLNKTADNTYFWGLCLLGAWAAHGIRAHRVRLLSWVALLLLTAASAQTFHISLYNLQQTLIALSERFFNQDVDPFKTSTSIGDIGMQKMFNDILFRASPETLPPNAIPLHLHEASYNVYSDSSWYAMQTKLLLHDNSTGLHPVSLQPYTGTAPYALEIQTRIRSDKTTLKLPPGTVQLDLLPKCSILTNSLGAVTLQKVEPRTIRYRAAFSPDYLSESPPTSLDVEVPEHEREAIFQIANQLKLSELPPTEAVQTLKHYFNTEFSYTLEHRGKGKHKTPLAYFLLERKAGQCELFATSTVLILRASGIPARYAVGYVAQEFSTLEQQFIIRQRHGHAWVRVYLDGRWQDLDTTSSNWLALEEDEQSPFQIISDFFSFISFSFSRLRWSQKDYLSKLAIGLLVLLILMIANRLRKQKKSGRKKIVRSKKKKTRKGRRQKQTSLERLEKEIAHKGWPRNPGEALIPWALRVQQAAPDLLNYPDLHAAIHQHYRQRFADDHAPSDNSAIVKQLLESIKE